ncbi:MAG: hypothetical protein HYZ58_02335 [Acidobacteria bacterium]|nr:hypothetical protein [Acidobacteriota bacterium]
MTTPCDTAVDVGRTIDRGRWSGYPGTGAPLKTLFHSGFRTDTVALWSAFLSCLFAVYLGLQAGTQVPWLSTTEAARRSSH